MLIGRPIEKIVDLITEILAFATVFLVAFLYINGVFGFLSADTAAALMKAREICIVAVLLMAGLQFALKRFFVIFIIYAVVMAVVIVFMCMSGFAL